MSFNNAVLAEVQDLGAGEVLQSKPNCVEAFEVFENGLVEGRFVKFDTGSIDILDGSSTPQIAGIAKRKINGEIGTGVYSTTGQAVDQVAEVITYGYATVTVTDAAEPEKYEPVYVINATGTDAGKATEDSTATGALAVSNVDFWEQKAAGVWLVRIKLSL